VCRWPSWTAAHEFCSRKYFPWKSFNFTHWIFVQYSTSLELNNIIKYSVTTLLISKDTECHQQWEFHSTFSSIRVLGPGLHKTSTGSACLWSWHTHLNSFVNFRWTGAILNNKKCDIHMRKCGLRGIPLNWRYSMSSLFLCCINEFAYLLISFTRLCTTLLGCLTPTLFPTP